MESFLKQKENPVLFDSRNFAQTSHHFKKVKNSKTESQTMQTSFNHQVKNAFSRKASPSEKLIDRYMSK